MDILKQLQIIKRGAVEIISEVELNKKLEESIKDKRPLVIKAGFDPTAPDIHLGHTVLLRKLRQFQDLGHKVVFLIGDFTARIGDPTGRNELRKQMTPEEVVKNAETYSSQIAKILDMKTLKTVFNSEWFDKMHGLEFGQLLTHYTATRMLERNDFTQRMKEKKPIYMSEFIYPILQGYDSVVLKADIELGGTDQKFNLLVGRELQKDFKQPEQIVITMPLLEGTDGIQKMSKSYGNYIGINESSKEMFGKIMSLSDSLMMKYFELLTDCDLDEIKKMHPKEAKMKLAGEIITCYHSKEEAEKARSEFERVFAQKETPQEIIEYRSDGKKAIISILTESGLVSSGNEARRLLKQGAVFFDNLKIEKDSFVPTHSGVLKAGSRRFLKVVV
ncbi:MAG: tyrosine--tRNA ligase [Candidatus Omnitrophica bacterium]|nr:tyrosine--tRNA ligase [Candidatus Omnitrophota bacterium]